MKKGLKLAVLSTTFALGLGVVGGAGQAFAQTPTGSKVPVTCWYPPNPGKVLPPSVIVKPPVAKPPVVNPPVVKPPVVKPPVKGIPIDLPVQPKLKM